MQKFTKSYFSLLILTLCAFIFSNCGGASQLEIDLPLPLQLWYTSPAESWMQEALPIGNGFMGAMFFGGIETEHIQFNEESLWSGGQGEWPDHNGGNRTNAYQHLPEVRRLLAEGKMEEAHQLSREELTGMLKAPARDPDFPGYGAYQAFGDLYIETLHSGDGILDYRRFLDISNAIGGVTYSMGNVEYKRTYWASYPSRVLVFRFENNAPEGCSYVVKQTSSHKNIRFDHEGNTLILSGTLESNGMEFESRLKIESEGGNIKIIDNKVEINQAKRITVYLTAATDYINEFPNYTGRDYKLLNKNILNAIEDKTYDQLFEEHTSDYKSLFDRVQLDLGSGVDENQSTDQRLKAYTRSGIDPGLEALYFQYGRYLLISSSRLGSLPANLQGKWNNSNNPPWASDYHANINIQMIYWPAEVTHLAECHEPLIEYIDRLRPPGRVTAQEHFGAGGWVVNTMNNVFGYTAPGWDFPWGFFPGGAGWYARHVWEHFQYNPDTSYLRNKAYPIMREAAEFWLDYLSHDVQGRLVSTPSYSPEHGGISNGAFMDIQIAWDLFNNCLAASATLGIEDSFVQEVQFAQEKLHPLSIGRWGQLQEWVEDVDDRENKHRHVSHLYALYPSEQIYFSGPSELVDAAKVSLNARGDGGTGWSLAWKINFWARLRDGNRAHKLLQKSLQLTNSEDFSGGGGVYANLLSTHPPFQLDGNMGTTAGIAEMLLQSDSKSVTLLPALPDAWPAGHVRGLKSKGGHIVDLKWENGKLLQAKITTDYPVTCTLHYKNESQVVQLKKGENEMGF